MSEKLHDQHEHNENIAPHTHFNHDHIHTEEHNHNHSHEHHGHKCDCGCEHEDEHISVYTHEMSIVGSIKCRLEKPYDESEQILDACMKEIANEVTKNDGIIGHIKAFMVAEGDSCMISITDEESNKRYMKGQYVNIEGVAIVFGVEPTKLHDILEKALHNLQCK